MAPLQLVVKPPTRKSSDVSTWRTALQSADMGRVKLLYDLFEDLLIDGVLSDAVDKRIGAVTNSPLTFQDADGQEVPEIVELIDSPDFEDLLTTIMNARFWGRAAGEFNFSDGFFGFTPIPFKHIKLENQTILINESDDKGIDYSNDDHILVIGKQRNFGLFLKTAPFAIWKRGGFGDYAQWIELFGMPQRVGKYSSHDPESRRLLEQAMEKAGSAPWIVIPKESDVETVNNTGTGSSSGAHNDFRKACNEEMLITILGQTMTTLDGSSKSQSETHKAVEEGKNRADMRYVRRVLNWLVVPMLEKRGFPVTGGKFVFPESTEELSVDDVVALSDIMEIPTSYLHEKYSIPVAKKGEPIARRNLESSTIATPKPVTGNDTNVESKQIKNSDDQNLLIRLIDFFVAAPGSGAKRQNFIARSINSIIGNINLADNYSININLLVDEALREIYNNPDQGLFNPRLFEITNNALQQAITVELNQESEDWGKTNKAFINQFRENTAVFAAFKNHQQTNEMVDLLVDENGNTRSFSKFKKLALQVSKDYNVNWLQTEYNTATRSARAAVNFRKYLETEHLYPNLEYLLSTAEQKSEEHLSYVGTILPIRHPWWEKHLPPSRWNCQCSVRPTNKPITAVPADDEPIDPVFANNPGQTAKFVNTEETPYYSNTDAGLRAAIEELAVRAERIRQRLAEIEFERKEFKSGGYIDIPKQGQNKNEEKDNRAVYGHLAKTYGDKYALLPVDDSAKSNPDALNLIDYTYSDAKLPQTTDGKNAIQNSIKSASAQKVDEVVIKLSYPVSYKELKDGLKAAFQKGRAKTIQTVILIGEDGSLKRFDGNMLRELFSGIK